MKIAAYSGSFNPLHIGHLSIMQALCDCGYDSVLLIVSPQNPLKAGIDPSSGTQRFQDAVEALERHPELGGKVIADDIELGMGYPSYTILTLEALKKKYPSDEISLAIGADNLSDIRRWKDYGRILREFGAVVYPRKGYAMEEIIRNLLQEDPHFRIMAIDAPIVEISSTAIRERTAAGEDMSAWLM